jgi:hypothetical protein
METIHAVAAWGLRTTWGSIKRSFKTTRRWVGPALGERSFEFDPMTGKSNYVEDVVQPEALTRWVPFGLGGDARRFDDDEWIVPVVCVRTAQHRVGRWGHGPEQVPPEVPADQLSAFKVDMTNLGLWNEDRYALWLVLDVSV